MVAAGLTRYPSMAASKPVNVFFCYAPQDEELRRKLEGHLALLERGGAITSWSSGAVGAGAAWRAEIDQQMGRADLILLLVSADFLASDHLYDVELSRAIGRHRAGSSTVIGVLLRPCDWQQGEIRKLVTLPRIEGRVVPVTAWPNQDAAFASIAEAVRGEATAQRAGVVGAISRNPRVAHSIPAPLG
jgi:hypothetical protein